eukprot:CAMPEP_0172191022 /NCGR_PEP_ID=MMETSP1050-20130122/23449_1 /TAXON_ID=233186 /ORGANISM="Cryptomonas curvata, Strain CCAP979/52" /LENGTH=115 /DNA_ID=CAMNT_0012865983 /DNA_START=189 /DNA_END=533 /DNA_ORIENTATION=+
MLLLVSVNVKLLSIDTPTSPNDSDDPAKPARDFHLSAQQSASLTATKLLYEQRGSFSPIFQLHSAPMESPHMFRQRVAAAPPPAPDEFDDDDFLSEPADIPVDPNSEVNREIREA